MWRCHCGEKNLSSSKRCQSCNAARLTHEDDDGAGGSSRRSKTVEVSFFGLRGTTPRGGEEQRPATGAEGGRAGETPPRLLTEEELAAHYAASRRRDLLTWTAWILVVLAVVALFAWQIGRSPR